MSLLLHLLTSVTKSFGAVCARRGMSFDLRAGASGQPEGLPEISRGLSVATPPESVRKTSCTPEGCENRSPFASRNRRDESLAPLRGAFPFHPLSGGVASLRLAQPPANFCETSGLEIAARRECRLVPLIDLAFLPRLQFTFVTKSFGAVRAFKGMSFDLRLGALGQAGGLPEISRGLSAATPPASVHKTSCTAKECENRSTFASRNRRDESLAPLRGAFPFHPRSGGVASLRLARPPANFCETSSLEIVAHRKRRVVSQIDLALLPFLQFTCVTKSFGVVRALKGVWFDLRAGAPGLPEGLPEISRGLSAATPPESARNTPRTPEGCQKRVGFRTRNHRTEFLAPLRGAIPFHSHTGGVASLRSAQPPANFCETSGLEIVAHRERHVVSQIELAFLPLLRRTSVTQPVGVVRAINGVSFDRRAVVSDQPGGLSDISRGLSTATPPESVRKTSCTPEGCQNRAGIRARNDRPKHPAPLRGAIPFHSHTGGVLAQPPANFCEPFRLVRNFCETSGLVPPPHSKPLTIPDLWVPPS